MKLLMESELLLREIRSVVLRVSNVYGPGQPCGRGQGVIAEWKNALATGKKIEVYGSLNSYRDYIYIDDLCEGIFKTLSLNERFKVLNIGSGIPTKLSQVLKIFSKYKFTETQIEIFGGRNTDRNGYFLDTTEIRKMLEWEAKYSLEEGILCTMSRLHEN
jgi:UDP-glucose 4-epimerase